MRCSNLRYLVWNNSWEDFFFTSLISCRIVFFVSAPAESGGIRAVQVKPHSLREIGNLLPNNQRQRRTCYALCHILYPVSSAHTSFSRMDSNSTSYTLVNAILTCRLRPFLLQASATDDQHRGSVRHDDFGVEVLLLEPGRETGHHVACEQKLEA